jgi:uncharacterized protein (TIGR03067 family)
MRCKIVTGRVTDIGRIATSIQISLHSCLDLNRKSNYKIGVSMRLRLIPIGLVVIGSVFTPNAHSSDGSKDLEALQGTWRLVSGEIGGRKMTAEELRQAKLVFKGDRYTVRRGSGPLVMGTAKLNSAKNPKTIDITDADGPYQGETLLGVYTVKGDGAEGVLRAAW